MGKGKKENLISEELYQEEIAMCKKLNSKDGGCMWGRCENCGVVPLLYKFKTGEIAHGKDLDELREEVFGNK